MRTAQHHGVQQGILDPLSITLDAGQEIGSKIEPAQLGAVVALYLGQKLDRGQAWRVRQLQSPAVSALGRFEIGEGAFVRMDGAQLATDRKPPVSRQPIGNEQAERIKISCSLARALGGRYVVHVCNPQSLAVDPPKATAGLFFSVRRIPSFAWFGRGRAFRSLTVSAMFLAAFAIGWFGENAWHPLLDVHRNDGKGELSIDAVVDRIIVVESDGDQKLKNRRSSATGLGQFLDDTWLDLIRSYRSDLAKGRSDAAILELRRDGKVAREITVRFTEQNARILKKRGLPVTPGTLYLAHFAGTAGAVAILSALENADAASVMANADVTGRTKREKIVKANPFLENLTVADLRSWADRKMRLPSS